MKSINVSVMSFGFVVLLLSCESNSTKAPIAPAPASYSSNQSSSPSLAYKPPVAEPLPDIDEDLIIDNRTIPPDSLKSWRNFPMPVPSYIPVDHFRWYGVQKYRSYGSQSSFYCDFIWDISGSDIFGNSAKCLFICMDVMKEDGTIIYRSEAQKLDCSIIGTKLTFPIPKHIFTIRIWGYGFIPTYLETNKSKNVNLIHGISPVQVEYPYELMGNYMFEHQIKTK
jgi:hypothetical protein